MQHPLSDSHLNNSANTLMSFSRINIKASSRISLLKSLFGKITITKIVADDFGKALPEFVEIENPKDKKYQKILETFLDPGEASAMVLALEKEECLLIIDEFKDRREAGQLGFRTFTKKYLNKFPKYK